jgi:transposase
MVDRSTLEAELTMGLDLGDTYSHYCVIDRDAEVVESGRLRTHRGVFERHFAARDSLRVAIEAGTQSPWVSRLLGELGHEVLVANPRRLRIIYENDTKNDRSDPERLARVARMDPKLLAPIQHRGAAAQADLGIIRAREAQMSARTQLVNHVRGAVESAGGRLPRCSTRSFAKKVTEEIPEQLWPALSPLINTIGSLSTEIAKFDKKIEELAGTRYPETTLLRQVAGIGALTALAYVLVIEDPTRFKRSRQVGSYLGLRPRQDESGQISRQLRITKAGDTLLRRLLVGSAQYILGPFGPDSDLRRWGLALAARGGKNAKKRAAVAVARKLAVLLHRLWVTGQPYVAVRRLPRRTRKTASQADTPSREAAEVT